MTPALAARVPAALVLVSMLAAGAATAAVSAPARPSGTSSAVAAPVPPVAAPRAHLVPTLPPERPDDPPGVPAPRPAVTRVARPASVVTFGRFTHVQVNVDTQGADITGDAANEPSIAVDPTNPDRKVIGWRQFDTVASNFRQAGVGFTTDGGATWTAGVIDPGVFRSDPVLGAEASGEFLYNSLTVSGNAISAWVFPSTDGGATWGGAVSAYGGDKQWMTVDRTGGPGNGYLYQAWSVVSNTYGLDTFDRSTDSGASFQPPIQIPREPIWGTLDLDANDSLYVVGMDPNTGDVLVARSPDASNALASPTFTTVQADLGGYIQTGGPNPDGLDGQLWIAVDRSGGPRDGWVYVLASVATPTDPLDVDFIRSTDGGKTWSAPVRVNDDPAGDHAWQWFGTMSVSPNGRIDVVWNDSRLSGDSTKVALFYSYSDDGGTTWSANEQMSPVWDCTLGYPNQAKIGDYYQMVSDVDGADLAWANTFNGGEDVWYTRIPHQTTAVAAGAIRPARLHPAAPNPFTASTAIRFDVPAPGARVRLEVFDPAGRRVATLADGFVVGGSHVATWDGRDAAGGAAAAGLYFCRYQAGGVTETRRLMRLR